MNDNLNVKIALDNQLSPELAKITRDIGNFTASAGSQFANVAKNITKVGLAVGAFGVFAGGGLLKAGSDVEKLRTALNTAMGGIEEDTEKTFKVISEFAKDTPYSINEVMRSFIKLKNMGLDPSERSFTSLGNTASAQGKSLNDIVEALADAATGEFERLKEFGIRTSKEGDKVKFTFQGITKEVGFNSEEIQNYIIGLGETKFAGGMEAQSKTLSGRLSTLKDDFSLAMSTIAKESGLMEVANKAIVRLSDFLSKIDWVGVGQRVGEFANIAMANLINVINRTIAIIQALSNFYQQHKFVIDTVIIVLGSFAIALGIVIGVIGIFVAVTTVATAIATGFGAVMAFILSPIGLVVLAIGALIATVLLLWRNWDWVGQQLGRIWDGLLSGIGHVHNQISNAINWIVDRFREIPNRVYSFGQGLWNGISNGIGNAHNSVVGGINWIIDRFREIPDRIRGAIGSLWDIGRDALGSFWKGLLSGLGRMGEAVKGGLRAAGFTGLASGTSYAKGGQYLVGETGPELVTLPRGASVDRSSDTRGMMGGMTININNPVVREEQDIYTIIEEVKKVLTNDQRLKRLGV